MKKLAIIGGGFAGAKVAKSLENKFETTLIDRKNFFEFTPGILRSIVDPKHLDKIELKHDEYLKMTKFVKGCVEKIENKKVLIKKSDPVEFDYLVIASGSSYNTPIKVKDIVIADRGKKLKNYHQKLLESEKVLIVGGGLVGIELAGEIVESYPGKEITIIQGNEKIMERNHPKSIKRAEKFLRKKGVKIVLNERVVEQKDNLAITDIRNSFEYDIIILCTGLKPNSKFVDKKFKNKKGFIKVNEFLQIKNEENIFVCGDVAEVNEEKTAQGAEKQAGVVIKNILAIKNGTPLKKYFPKKRPMVISLGKFKGIFEWNRFVFSGIIPAFMKWAVERKTMIRYQRA